MDVGIIISSLILESFKVSPLVNDKSIDLCKIRTLLLLCLIEFFINLEKYFSCSYFNSIPLFFFSPWFAPLSKKRYFWGGGIFGYFWVFLGFAIDVLIFGFGIGWNVDGKGGFVDFV